ncbi:MAG: rRNA maturation RNase YbeY [Acidobacteria bacterium]|nr:rRNA maturation RNase YbeY [Acidobacteriota bacterium]
MIEVVNKQRRVALDGERWRGFAAAALKKIGAGEQGATVVFVSDRAMRGLNRKFRGRNATTDVLSFPVEQAEFERVAGATLGDVVISVEQAEIAQLILHGLLHLCGYDHETDGGEMNALELRLRRRLGV